MQIWMFVTKDKYEMPLAVADSVGELGQLIGRKKSTICSAMSRAKRRGTRCRYVKVEVEDDDDRH